jgi:hypothetical protein
MRPNHSVQVSTVTQDEATHASTMAVAQARHLLLVLLVATIHVKVVLAKMDDQGSEIKSEVVEQFSSRNGHPSQAQSFYLVLSLLVIIVGIRLCKAWRLPQVAMLGLKFIYFKTELFLWTYNRNTAADLFERTADACGNHLALVFEGKAISFSYMDQQANRLVVELISPLTTMNLVGPTH